MSLKQRFLKQCPDEAYTGEDIQCTGITWTVQVYNVLITV